MRTIKYIALALVLLSANNIYAQRSAKEFLRKGNKHYSDSIYDKAAVNYLKTIELDTAYNAIANYNLGNALLFQNKAEDALKHYSNAVSKENDKSKLAEIYHNSGVIYQAAKDYAKAVEAYKQSLRNNPHDHNTRYNLALAMEQLKKQQQEQQQNKDQQEQKEEQKQEQQQQKQQEQEQQKEEQQRQQQQQQEQEMSKENAEQLLESAMQDEKDVQEKVKKLMQIKGRKLDKDW
ncbi:MAG: tetratricopeptide repeat protein [Bacteroidaceae bacterium]|nr:tetratricopeptide repeat protein [Bacteroidaceae bacterium]